MKIGPYDLPNKYDMPLRAGVRFFICRYPKETETDKGLMGPFDVRCSEIPDYMNRRQAFDLKWRAGLNAGVQFFVQDDGKTAIAFMPDDVYYHNRVVLADHQWIYVEGLYAMKSGMMSASDAQLEISCLREVLTYDRPIFKIMDKTGQERDYRYTREEAEEVLQTKRIMMLGRGQVARDVFPYKGCTIVTGTKRDKKPEIKELIKKYSRMPYGWTSCEEFLHGIRTDVEKLIAQRRGKSGADMSSDIGSQFKQWFARLTPDQLQQMVSTMGNNNGAPAVPQAAVSVAPAAATTAEPIETAGSAPVLKLSQEEMDKTYTKAELYAKTKAWLLGLAIDKYRLPLTVDYTRPEIAKMIVEAQEEAATLTVT